MKLKYYLRGAGIGLITATLILMVAFAVTKDNSKIELSDEEIMARAEKLGMIKLDYDDSNDVSSDQTIDEPKPLDEQIDISETTNNAESVDSDNSEVVSQVAYKAFSINGGQGSLEVSQNLQKAGLISNAEKFNEFIISAGIDSRIQPGTFYIQEGISEEDLAVILITKQADRVTTLPKTND